MATCWLLVPPELSFSFGATTAAVPSSPEDEHGFISGSEESPRVVKEASCWALARKDSLHGSHMWTQRGPRAAPSCLDTSPQLWSGGCWSYVLTAGGCSGDGRGQAWERSPPRGHTSSETDIVPPSNQKHAIFLPKPRSACV